MAVTVSSYAGRSAPDRLSAAGVAALRPPARALIRVERVEAAIPAPGEIGEKRRAETIPVRPAAVVETGINFEQRKVETVAVMVVPHAVDLLDLPVTRHGKRSHGHRRARRGEEACSRQRGCD